VTLHPNPPFETVSRLESFINGGIKIIYSFKKAPVFGRFFEFESRKIDLECGILVGTKSASFP